MLPAPPGSPPPHPSPLPDPVAPTAPTDEPSDPATDTGPPTGGPAGPPEADHPGDEKKKKTVKKIVKKVPVATRAGTAPTAANRAPAARPAVPLAKTDDLRALPPPPAGARPGAGSSAATAARRPPPPVAAGVASAEEVRRVGLVKRRRLGRLRARKVRRILRHVEVWSVLKVSVVFYFCLWLVLLVSGAVVWKVATQAGLIDNVENFLQESGFDEVDIDGETMFRAWATGGFIMVFASTGFTVLLAVLFNLISDMMGGVRFTVIELETIRRRKPNRTRRDASRPSNRP